MCKDIQVDLKYQQQNSKTFKIELIPKYMKKKFKKIASKIAKYTLVGAALLSSSYVVFQEYYKKRSGYTLASEMQTVSQAKLDSSFKFEKDFFQDGSS